MSVFLFITMQKYLCFSFLFIVFIVSCKSKKITSSADASSDTTAVNNSSALIVTGNTSGIVSHKYNSTGCSTVIIVKQEDGEITLIPKDKLPGEFDVDGLMVLFNYHTLRMPQPQGCSVGIPAEITTVSRK
jgi:hypothetical protein